MVYRHGLPLLIVGLFALCSPARAGDVDEITALLHDFLKHASEASAHDRFWAEDLVYTSSRGTRTDKAEIMAGFDETEADSVPDTEYSAEDVDIRLYGDMAVVAFRLVGAPTSTDADGDPQYYFNTGTFLKRDGIWKVVAWQATKIP